MRTLNPYEIPLSSINLIEASAGTGKSWTVTLLFLRLILEKNLTVDQILVVTFTEAATKELRDDVRQRLVGALAAFKAINEHGLTDALKKEYGEVLELIERESDYEEAIRRLNRAKLSLDEAAIFTIHGFCQRTLSENAFEAGLPFESELMDDDSELMQKLTDDFWRRYTDNAPKSLIFKLHQKSVTPDSLLKDIRNAVGKPYLELCGPENNVNCSNDASSNESEKTDKWDILEKGLQNIVKQWQTDGAEITQILLEDKNLNGNKFRKPTVAKLCNEMNQIKALFDINADFIESAQKFKHSYIETGTKAKCTPPEHSFFSAWESFSELWEQLNKGSDDFLNNTRIELLRYLQEELPKEKKRLGVLSFDDLLLQLQQALKTNPQLAIDLRKKYQAALIDEFQDTDPIQYDIFSTIYNDPHTQENAVFLVGDPKQAIYSFRGGDIHTYLKAKADTDESNHHTLKTNWRSHDKLISAFNTLYAQSDNPFQDEGIEYVQVKSGKDLNDIQAPEARTPLQLWRFNQTPGEKPDGKPEPQSADAIRKEIADAVAGDIAELLNASNQGKATIEGKPIGGGDIAILIRSHTQGDMIKAALNQRKIASVQSSKQSIFETHEAVEIHRLLTAIADPQREDNVRRALVTELMGYQAQDLLDLESDSNAWEEILLLFQNWQYQWKHHGFLPMMRALMKSQNTHQHLLNFMDGERRITNTLHLAEIIHQAVRKKSLSIEEVLLWLKQRQENSSATESELRLESDENLVKIVTIHKSKGLEYPIVYCPYVGLSPKANSDKIFTFHKDERSYLEIGSSESDEHKELKKQEELAEDTRLLYVALTRAKYQCNIVVFPETISGSPDRSALGWLLTNGKSNPSGSGKAEKEQKAEFKLAYEQNLLKLETVGNGNISLDDLPEYPQDLVYQPIETNQTLTAREFTAEIKSQAQITSFSGLTAGAHAETPDYDSFVEINNKQIAQADDGAENIVEAFPKGATAGTALHEIYENIDFTQPLEEQTETFDRILEKYSFEEKHKQAAMRLIGESIEAELHQNQMSAETEILSLNKLSKAQRLDEMEFYLPLERLDIEKLKQTLFQHLPVDDESDTTPKWRQIREAVDTLYFDEVEGYLKGFIDLIFEYNGKYYLADYKSNTLENYAPEKLFTPMAEAHYYLQYLIYCVALHRYLEQRLPSYQWETHFGGAYYLFIRGMTKTEQLDQDSQKSASKWGGVFYHKPSLDLINALDGLFMRLPSHNVQPETQEAS
ncbi:exodeoxyribonuclease V subunit beta [Cocleimonas flava]|uniref:RecBCD enzyme subunit RecB n=1 Tax=Cocleimonas flava TaxID=634765 RepID=A0A4R1ESS3_9GAMM|nr:exodeoxyribonuclease V subunit beta [Cocleimonas flava]TCJ84646.1 DNA helicase/exodeoxyribonuclease V beta subunit [Cocleimonas flava]